MVTIRLRAFYLQVSAVAPQEFSFSLSAADTHVTWGVNLGRNNISAATLAAHSIFRAFSEKAFTDAGIILDAIEIGNEPDLYSHNGDRQSNYSVSDYVS